MMNKLKRLMYNFEIVNNNCEQLQSNASKKYSPRFYSLISFFVVSLRYSSRLKPRKDAYAVNVRILTSA